MFFTINSDEIALKRLNRAEENMYKVRNRRPRTKKAFAESKRELHKKREEMIDIFKRKKLFTVPFIGGKTPEDFAIDPSILEMFHYFMKHRFLELMRNDTDLFFDNSSLGIFSLPFLTLPRKGISGFGELYRSMIFYTENKGYKEKIEELINLAERYNGFFLDILRRRSVIVISNVVDEFDMYWKGLRESAQQNVTSKVLRDRIFDVARELYNAAKQNNEKHLDIEDDPLIERIMDALPSNDEISETDRKIVSTAVASGACDGRRKGIVTSDKHIDQLASVLYSGIRDGSIVLDVSDLAGSVKDFDPFNLMVHTIRLYTREFTGQDAYAIKTRKYFDILDSKK